MTLPYISNVQPSSHAGLAFMQLNMEGSWACASPIRHDIKPYVGQKKGAKLLLQSSWSMQGLEVLPARFWLPGQLYDQV